MVTNIEISSEELFYLPSEIEKAIRFKSENIIFYNPLKYYD